MLLFQKCDLPHTLKLFQLNKEFFLFFLHVSNVLDVYRGMCVQLPASYAEACSNPPFLRHPPLDLACPPFLNFCFPSPLFCSTSFQGILHNSPHPHVTPSYPNPTNQPLNKYQKSDFTSSTVTFYQKSIFNLLNHFINRLS